MTSSVGVIDLRTSGWAGGSMYSRVLLKSLVSAADSSRSIVWLSDREPPAPGADFLRVHAESSAGAGAMCKVSGAAQAVLRQRGGARMARTLGLRLPTDAMAVAAKAELDVVLPVTAAVGRSVRSLPSWISWIPDFQHLHYPEFFGPGEAARRHQAFMRLASEDSTVMVSSRAIQSDLISSLGSNARVAVLPFPSRFAFDSCDGQPERVRAKYHLPPQYLYCPNQIWAHKNHRLLIDGLHEANRLRGDRQIILVLTGMPLDDRSPTNQPVSDLLQRIAELGLASQVHFLGFVTETDVDDLLRGCVALIQPSLSEGWSTSVQDAKALGKQVLALDSPILREQAPDATFFTNEASDVARELAAVWEGPRTECGGARETRALEEMKAFGLNHGRALLDLCDSTTI